MDTVSKRRQRSDYTQLRVHLQLPSGHCTSKPCSTQVLIDGTQGLLVSTRGLTTTLVVHRHAPKLLKPKRSIKNQFTFCSKAFGQIIAYGAASVHSEAAPANELNTRGTAVRSKNGAVHKDEWDCLFPNGPALRPTVIPPKRPARNRWSFSVLILVLTYSSCIYNIAQLV